MPKTPITYYGGKQNMLRHIMPNIPEHTIYTEAFVGGGAVFFAKEPVASEIINDSDGMVVNFYRVVKTRYKELKLKIEETLFSRATYSVALAIYRMPHLFGGIQRAWAFYVATNMGFACHIGSWGYDRYGKRLKSFLNKKLAFDEGISRRLSAAQIECNDALTVIRAYDTVESFHYIDPPYVGTDLGHYGGYCEGDYRKLLDTLTGIKGKFLLSCFPTDILNGYIEGNGWQVKTFDKPKSATKGTKGSPRLSRKTEVLVANYELQ